MFAGLSRLRLIWRVTTEAVVGLIGLAVLGAILGPQWDPVPLESDLRCTTIETEIGDAPPLGHYQVRESTVTVQIGEVTVQARVTEPIGAADGRPGVVFVHGAGSGRLTAFSEQAKALAAAGVVVLVPEKRLDTYSTTHRDYVAMASDYSQSVAVLREWPGVDPARVGVYAESEGAWIAPVMAAHDPKIAFVVLVSAPVLPPREQAAFAVDNYLRNTGVPSDLFRAIPRAVGMSVPGAFEYVDFDVRPYQAQMLQPVLVAYGTADSSMPLIQATDLILADTGAAGNRNVTVRFYEGANHGLRVDGHVTPDFLTDLAGWVTGLPGTADAAPHIAGAQPTQQFKAGSVPTPRWLRDGTAMIVVVAAAAGGLVVAGILGLTQRVIFSMRSSAAFRRGMAGPKQSGIVSEVGVPLTWVGLGAISTVAMLVWYLTVVARLAADYERDALVVTGGWAVVRIAGATTVVAATVGLRAVVVLVRGSRPVVTGVIGRIVLGLGAIGCATLLVVLAYWGVFQLGI